MSSSKTGVSILSSPGMVCHALSPSVFHSWKRIVSILSSPGMVCHIFESIITEFPSLFLSCHHQEWYATWRGSPCNNWRTKFLSCHHQEWYATAVAQHGGVDPMVSILSSPGMVCHPEGDRLGGGPPCFYPVITRNGMPQY